MLFANDIVLVDETRHEVDVKLETWRNTLESKGFYGQEIPKSKSFRYLGSIIHKDGEIEEDLNHRIRDGGKVGKRNKSIV